MRKNKILEKLLAIILIFTLTSANFAFVTKAYASSITEALFGTGTNTGSKNVSFDAYFGTEEDNTTSVISDVNNQELAISTSLNVEHTGYLKDAKLEIMESEEGKGINFKLKEVEELQDPIQGIEDNVIYLRQINASTDTVNVNIPIEYMSESYMNEENLSKDVVVRFSGVYVDDEGDDIEVNKDVTLNVSWKDSRKAKVETSATKFIDFGAGVILQTVVKVDSQTEGNTLPTKENELTINAPVIEGATPDNVYVVANSTLGTNGKSIDQIIFGEDNWSYNKDENKVSIKVINEKETVRINYYEDEYLQDIDKEIIEEERYYNGTGIDEYLVTYTYYNTSIPEEVINLESTINNKLVVFSGVQDDENINIVNDKETYTYTLDGKIGELISLNIENQTTEISKAYSYLNYEHNDRYEMEFDSQIVVNVSYKEIINKLSVEDLVNTYIDKEGNIIENNDVYYKQISISKENFDNLLGEEGSIKVFADGNEVAVVNNESMVDEQGNIVITFESRYSRLNFEMTTPISEGNIVIAAKKAMSNCTLDRELFKNVSSIVTESALRVEYDYVDGIVEVGRAKNIVNLKDTTTKATLSIDRESLSTLAENEDVEFRIALNNETDVSDVYGHSVFEFDLPEYVESFEVTNYNLLYAEGLTISAIEAIDRTIRITLDGVQEGINSGALTNGANIVLNTNIKINLFTPAKSEIIKLRYSNDKATNYVENGEGELEIRYSAPTGLVAINSTFNYNNAGSVLTSVRQGVQEDLIDIFSEAKNATMEIVVMNNNSNTISNIAVLGRIPFEGVKDIATGDDLGTTVDTRLVSGIVSDERNNTEVNVYYSENKEATKDLNDSNNGWVLNPESLDNMKSFLIVPVDEDYIMEEASILRYTYQYEIPANLPHNENIYGTFQAYYSNNSEVAVTDETANPDKVGLSTGEGPEVSIAATVDRTEVKEFEEVQMVVVGSNIGNEKAEDIEINVQLPEYTKYSSIDIEDGYDVQVENNAIRVYASSLEANEDVSFKVYFVTDETPEIDDYKEELEEKGEDVSKIDEDVEVQPKVTIQAKDLGKVMEANTSKIKIKKADLKIEQFGMDSDNVGTIFDINYELYYQFSIENLKDQVRNNVVVTVPVPEELDFMSADIMGYANGDDLFLAKVGEGSYDESSRTVTFNIGTLKNYEAKQIEVKLKVARIPEGLTKSVVETVAHVQAEGTDSYSSNTILTPIGKAVLVVEQTSTNENTYIKEGDPINYIFTVRNEGSVVANAVTLTDVIPDGIRVNSISYISDGILCKQRVSKNNEAVISTTVEPNTELVVTVAAVASTLQGAQEKSVTNYAKLHATNIDETTTNSITHIVEAVDTSATPFDDSVSTDNSGLSTSGSNVTKTYKVSGIAWLDSNNNGMRDNGEELLSGITCRLINSESGHILQSTTTDSNGNYTFAGVQNGNYLVIFDYDTVKYTVTAFHKEDVASNVNSDAIVTQVTQDGKMRNAAITDVISVTSGSISNIDIGLVYAATFDLSLDKTITKLTTQNAVGKTDTNNYDNAKIAKAEIKSRYLSGSSVYVQYAITVKNNGDIGGYAKKIVDYIPEGMTFNSSLEQNHGWYSGTDGNLYNDSLAEVEITPGESKTINLVLTKTMTDENTGIVNNLAEIYEDYNIYGISDKNSTPANKAQGENDLGSADISILVSTGESLIYTSVIITTLLLGIIVVFVVYTKITTSRKRKEGGV